MKFLIIFGFILSSALGLPSELNRADNFKLSYLKDAKKTHTADSRIVNGKDAERNQFPYQISLEWHFLLISAGHICGGSLISQYVVLTAAHCIQSTGTHVAVAGNLNRGENTDSTQKRDVSSVLKHPDWDSNADISTADIAILKLKSPLRFTNSINAITLPKDGNNLLLGTAIMTGWGFTDSGEGLIENFANTLQYATKSIITLNQCSTNLMDLTGGSGPLDGKMVCVSGSLGVTGCKGDSGGPLAQDGTLIGIASFGVTPCGTKNAPTVFTGVSSHLDWIKSNI